MPVVGAIVQWDAPQGGTLTNAVTTSDAQGNVSANFTTGPAQQDYTVRVTPQGAGAGPPLTFTIRNQNTAVTVPAKQVITPQTAAAVGAPAAQLNNVRQRLDQLRLQGSPTATQGLKLSLDGQALPSTSAFALAPMDKDGKPLRGGGAAADKPDPFERWGVFINGDVDIGKQSTVGDQTGFKVRSKGITVGADYRLMNNSVLGGSVGFFKSDTNLDANAGTQNAKGYSFSFYGSYVPAPNAYIDGILNVGHNTYDGTRIGEAGASFNNNTSGDGWGFAVSGGYAFNNGPLALTPYGRVEYVDAKVNGFTETGAVAANVLTISEQRVKATTLALGGSASYAINTSWGVLLPNGRLEWQYLAQSNAQNVMAQIPGSAPTQIQILGQDKSFGIFAVGVSGLFGHGLSAFFNYQQLFGKENVTNQLYTLGVRLDF